MDLAVSRGAAVRLVVLCVAQFMLILDVVVVNVALPAMRADLGIPDGQLSLVGVSYTLTFGALLVMFGRIGDLIGRRRLFLAGVTLFGAASLATGVAPEPWVVFAGRAAQGIGAAMVSPTALALLLSAFPEGAARNRALGVWGAVGSAGAIAGQLLGGVLTDGFGWRSVFLINIPVAVAVVAVALVAIGDNRPAARERLDVAGAAVLTVSLFALTGALVRVSERGADVVAGALAIAAVAGLLVLARIERRHATPLIDPRMAASRTVRTGNAVLALNAGVVTAALFFTTLYLQEGLGMRPLAVGLGFAPVTVIVLVVSPIAGKLVSRYGVRPLLLGGAAVGIVGLAYLARVPADGTYVRDVLPGLALLAIMAALSYAPAFVVGTTGVRGDEHGLASGLLSTSQELGAALGLAAISSIGVMLAGSATSIAGFRAGFGAAAVATVATLIIASTAPRGLGTATATPDEESPHPLAPAGSAS